MKTRIVIVEDHASLRGMLTLILSQNKGYEVIGQADSGLSAIQLCRNLRPDLVILDLVLPELSGTEVLRRLRVSMPSVRVLVYSGTCNQGLVIETLKNDPDGFVNKSDSLETLREAIDAVATGCKYFSPFASRFLFNSIETNGRDFNLSEREREIVQLIAEGFSSKEISGRLQIAVRTVENHRANVMQKLHLHDVASLTLYAVRHGIVTVEQ